MVTLPNRVKTTCTSSRAQPFLPAHTHTYTHTHTTPAHAPQSVPFFRHGQRRNDAIRTYVDSIRSISYVDACIWKHIYTTFNTGCLHQNIFKCVLELIHLGVNNVGIWDPRVCDKLRDAAATQTWKSYIIVNTPCKILKCAPPAAPGKSNWISGTRTLHTLYKYEYLTDKMNA